MNKSKQYMMALIALIGAFLSRQASAVEFTFPLRHAPILTATFGEYRINHLHSGIDLGTNGEEGVPVLAAADGRLAILRAGPSGFGKVIYLMHEKDTVTVYGHLSEFSERFQTIAEKIQVSSNRFSFEKQYGDDGPSVKAGEIIGYVGTTGTDVPHLHFEVRKGGLPLNPLTSGLHLDDTIAPRVKRLYAYPLDAAAHVSGSGDGRFFDFSSKEHRIDKPIAIGGRVGLAVEVEDGIDGSPRIIAPYEIQFFIDDKLFWSVRYQRSDYADKTVSELDYIYQFKEEKIGIFHRLFRHSIRSFLHEDNLTGDLSVLTAGEHSAKIISRDASGNLGSAEFTLSIDRPFQSLPVLTSSESCKNASPYEKHAYIKEGFLSVEASEFGGNDPIMAASASFSPSVQKIPPLYSRPSGKGYHVDMDIPTKYEGTVNLAWKTSKSEQCVSVPITWVAEGKTISSDDGSASIEIPRGALFQEFPTLVSSKTVSGSVGLSALTKAFSLSQSWEPIRNKLQVSFHQPAGGRNGAGIYLLDRGRFWHLNNGSSTKVTHLGSFLLMRDTSPPDIGSCKVERLRGRRILSASYSDGGSGVPEDGIRMTVDGKNVLIEQNPVMNNIRYIPSTELKSGIHSVMLSLTDRSGNSSSKKFQVVVP